MKFNEKLKELRKEKGWSQEELAEKVSVSRQAVTKWEAGEGYPEIENLKYISTLFGKSIDELVKEDYESQETTEETISTIEIDSDHNTKSKVIVEQIDNIEIDQALRKIEISTFSIDNINIVSSKRSTVFVELTSKHNALINNDILLKLKRSHGKLAIILKKKGLFGYINYNYSKELDLTIHIPEIYKENLEISTIAEAININSILLHNLEINSTCSTVNIDNVQTSNTDINGVDKELIINKFIGNLEISCVTSDIDITYDNFNSNLVINSVSAKVKINIPKDSDYMIEQNGLSTRIDYRIDDKQNDRIKINGIHKIEVNGVQNSIILNEYTI